MRGTAPTRPPPKVWCVTLKRNPPLTSEDEPPLGLCAKICIKIIVIPPALITYLIGWIMYGIVYFIGCICCPLVGPGLFTMLAQARMASYSNDPQAQQRVKEDAQAGMCCARCLVSTAIFTYMQMILPLSMFCNW